MKTTTKARRKPPAANVVPTHWDELTAAIARNPLDDMYSYRPEIQEAITLIKHAGPAPLQVLPLVAALRLLVDATIECARNIQYIEPNLSELVNLLHEHIAQLGLIPDEGRWTAREASARVALGPIETAFFTKFFPEPAK